MGIDRSNKLKKNSKNHLFVIFFIVFFTIIIFFLNKNFFIVKKIVCDENGQKCSKATIDKIESFHNRSIFFTNFDDTLGQFSDYQLKKKLPNEINLSLTNVQSNYYGLDENNRFIVVENDQLEKNINQIANEIHNQLKEEEISFESVELKNGILIIELKENLRALISSDEIDLGIIKLKLILDNLSLKEIDTGIIEIDTRYKMPILKTKLSDI